MSTSEDTTNEDMQRMLYDNEIKSANDIRAALNDHIEVKDPVETGARRKKNPKADILSNRVKRKLSKANPQYKTRIASLILLGLAFSMLATFSALVIKYPYNGSSCKDEVYCV